MIRYVYVYMCRLTQFVVLLVRRRRQPGATPQDPNISGSLYLPAQESPLQSKTKTCHLTRTVKLPWVKPLIATCSPDSAACRVLVYCKLQRSVPVPRTRFKHIGRPQCRRLVVWFHIPDMIYSIRWLKWEYPKNQGPNIDPNILESLLQGLLNRAPVFFETPK